MDNKNKRFSILQEIPQFIGSMVARGMRHPSPQLPKVQRRTRSMFIVDFDCQSNYMTSIHELVVFRVQ